MKRFPFFISENARLERENRDYNTRLKKWHQPQNMGKLTTIRKGIINKFGSEVSLILKLLCSVFKQKETQTFFDDTVTALINVAGDHLHFLLTGPQNTNRQVIMYNLKEQYSAYGLLLTACNIQKKITKEEKEKV